MKTMLLLLTLVLALAPCTRSEESPKTISPWDKDDGQWITIFGKVARVESLGFNLNYGEGAIRVEMDGYDEASEARFLSKGDHVLVIGRVDADREQKRSIEAASVYVDKLKKTFFANPDDEEEVVAKVRQATSNGASIVISGQVSSVIRDFITVSTAYQKVHISTQTLERGDKGKPEFEVGDAVTVYGIVTDGFSGSTKVVAAHIVRR